MKPPERLRVGPVYVNVIFKKPEKCLGEFITEEGILIDPDVKGSTLAEVFLHEVLHAIFYYYALEPKRGEETTIGQFSSALTDFWSRNPTTHKWWTSLL